MPHEEHQEIELLGLKLDLVIADSHAPGVQIRDEVPNLQARGAASRRVHLNTAQVRLDASHQLTEAERLGDVIVGTDFKPNDPIDVLTARREHDDGGCTERAN